VNYLLAIDGKNKHQSIKTMHSIYRLYVLLGVTKFFLMKPNLVLEKTDSK